MRERGVTQTDLSGSLGLSQSTISAKLHGHRRWTVRELDRLADMWGLSLDELTGRKAAK